MIVADVMVRRVLAVSPETPLPNAIRLMTEHKVSGLPVLGPEGQIVGMLTEGDLLRRVETDTAGEPAGWLVRLRPPGREPAK